MDEQAETNQYSPEAQGTTREWLHSLDKGDRVLVWYVVEGTWYRKVVTVSYRTQKGYIAIGAAAPNKLRIDSYQGGRGWFDIDSGKRCRVFKFNEETPEEGEYWNDFICPLTSEALANCNSRGDFPERPNRKLAQQKRLEAMEFFEEEEEEEVEEGNEEFSNCPARLRRDLDAYATTLRTFIENTFVRRTVSFYWMPETSVQQEKIMDSCQSLAMTDARKKDHIVHLRVPPDCSIADLYFELLALGAEESWGSYNCSSKIRADILAVRQGRFPKTVSERRRIALLLFDDYGDWLFLLRDADNLTIPALNELYYLFQQIDKVAMFLTGNERLRERINNLGNRWFRECPTSDVIITYDFWEWQRKAKLQI